MPKPSRRVTSRHVTTYTSSYTKLHRSILQSSIWFESHSTLKVWIGMLALCDASGFVHTSRVGLRQACAVTDDELTTALEVLEGPDPDSRTSDADGRRVERVEGGWVVLNYAQYRDRTTDAKAKASERQRKYRERQRAKASRNVTGQTERRDSPKAEAEEKAEAEAEAEDLKSQKAAPLALSLTVAEAEVVTDVDRVAEAFCNAYRAARPNATIKPSSINTRERKLIKAMLKQWGTETICGALESEGQAALRAGPGTDRHRYFTKTTVLRNEANFTRVIERYEAGGESGGVGLGMAFLMGADLGGGQ